MKILQKYQDKVKEFSSKLMSGQCTQQMIFCHTNTSWLNFPPLIRLYNLIRSYLKSTFPPRSPQCYLCVVGCLLVSLVYQQWGPIRFHLSSPRQIWLSAPVYVLNSTRLRPVLVSSPLLLRRSWPWCLSLPQNSLLTSTRRVGATAQSFIQN